MKDFLQVAGVMMAVSIIGLAIAFTTHKIMEGKDAKWDHETYRKK